MRGLRFLRSSRDCFISGRVSGTGSGEAPESCAPASPAAANRPNRAAVQRRMNRLPFLRAAAPVLADHAQGRAGADGITDFLLDGPARARLEREQDGVAAAEAERFALAGHLVAQQARAGLPVVVGDV